MSAIMARLHADHSNVATLLDFLEEQIESVRGGGSADFDLMRDVMHYMIHYPDAYHHPREDLVFERLLELDEGARPHIDVLIREHWALAEKGPAFHDVLCKVEDGALVAREEIERMGLDYVDFLRAHLRREDEHVFPLAEDRLSEEDWAAIDEAMQHRDDPLFGPLVENEYRNLFDYISRQVE